MRSVLLVDDETLARTGLRSLIDWSRLGFSQVLEASSASEALALLRRTHIDTIIADVVMPELDGIDLAEEVHSSWPQMPIILITSFEDFENARRAVSSGATVLLAKRELTSERLEEALRSAATVDVGLSPLRNADPALSRLLVDALGASDRFDPSLWRTHGVCAVAAVRFPTASDALSCMGRHEDMCDIGAAVLGPVVWLVLRNVDDEAAGRVVQRIAARSRAAARWVIASGSTLADSSPLDDLRAWLASEFWKPLADVHPLDDAPPPPPPADNVFPPVLQQAIHEQFAHGTSEQLSGAVRDAARHAQRGASPVSRFRISLVAVLAKVVAASPSTPANVAERLADLGRAHVYPTLEQLIDAIVAMQQEWRDHLAHTRRFDPRIVAALDTIERTLPGRPSIETLATSSNMSVSAFSRHFRQTLGFTFRDYVAVRRVQRAQHIMSAEPNVLVYEVAERVGFDDVRQFNRIFARWAGLRPSEFRGQVQER